MSAPAVAVWLVLLAANPPDKPSLSNVQVSVEGQTLRVSLRLEDALTERFLERLHSGLPTGFMYRFALFRKRGWWFIDNTIRKSSLEVTAMYDAVSREYTINYKHDRELTETLVVRELDELESAMTQLSDFALMSLADLKTEKQVQLKARAELGSRTFLAFIPSKITTDWVVSRPLRPPEAIP